MSFLTKFISKLRRRSKWGHTIDDVLTMCDKGAFADAYTLLCELIEKQSGLSKHGGICALLAELELLANDNASKAIELLDRALDGDRGGLDMIYYYRVRGKAMFDTGKYEEAVKNFEQAVALDDGVENLKLLGQVLSEINDSGAMGVWKQILEKDPKNCLACANLGIELVKSGDKGRAMLMARRAEKLNPSSEELYRIGLLYYDLDEYGMAINSFLEANRLGYEDKGFLYACVAACYLSMNEAVPARKYVQWAIRCNPENYYVKDVLHEYEERFGNIEQNNKDREEK